MSSQLPTRTTAHGEGKYPSGDCCDPNADQDPNHVHDKVFGLHISCRRQERLGHLDCPRKSGNEHDDGDDPETTLEREIGQSSGNQIEREVADRVVLERHIRPVEQVSIKRRFGFCSGGIYNSAGVVARFSGTFYFPDHKGMWKDGRRGDGVLQSQES